MGRAVVHAAQRLLEGRRLKVGDDDAAEERRLGQLLAEAEEEAAVLMAELRQRAPIGVSGHVDQTIGEFVSYAFEEDSEAAVAAARSRHAAARAARVQAVEAAVELLDGAAGSGDLPEDEMRRAVIEAREALEALPLDVSTKLKPKLQGAHIGFLERRLGPARR